MPEQKGFIMKATGYLWNKNRTNIFYIQNSASASPPREWGGGAVPFEATNDPHSALWYGNSMLGAIHPLIWAPHRFCNRDLDYGSEIFEGFLS